MMRIKKCLVVFGFFLFNGSSAIAQEPIDCHVEIVLSKDQSKDFSLRVRSNYALRGCMGDVSIRETLVAIIKQDQNIEIRKMVGR